MARKRDDYFSGKTEMSLCFTELYNRLMTGEWVGYEDVLMAIWPQYTARHPEEKFREWRDTSYSNRPLAGTLKKTWMKLVAMLREITGSQECIIENGKRKGKKIRYDLSYGPNPLKYLKDAEAIQSIKRYVQFCQDLDGLVPRVWTDYFLRDTRDLLDIKERRSKQCIKANVNPELTNLELLPMLYEAIINQKVLKFDYENLPGQHYKDVVFHPQFLREYNGRWYLYGETKAFEAEFTAPFCNIAIDRIQTKPIIVATEPYKKAPAKRYEDNFSTIIGVTHLDLNCPSNHNNSSRVYVAQIRALKYNVYHLIETKKLHPTQRVIKKFNQDDGYGEFELNVELNYEFVGVILAFGDGVQIVGEPDLLQYFREMVVRPMAEQYGLVPKKE